MKIAFFQAVRSFVAEFAMFSVIYFGLAFLKILPLDINWIFLFCVWLVIFMVQLLYFYFRK